MDQILKWFFLYVGIIATSIIVVVCMNVLLLYRSVEDNLYLANTATYSSIDLNRVREFNELAFVDQTEAEKMFRQTLKNAFDLDDNLSPTEQSSKAIAGPIRIRELSLKNENEAKTLGGTKLNKNPAVYSKIEVPISILGITITSNVSVLTILPTSY
ncbi:hypothetical protein ERICIV_04544 (plasmid) [Paenibacillus larvae subsp. larvae]|uniref:Uncharacterized protein n=1 Tax=Paenibacillus larvae subsp. larvae TaxID=147375 RepID=A0A2L1U7L9_9BACL|nr:hypothetical protein [Paenibacillus larvae]AQT87002.1 hypothetical protein B1222_23505 [Paenibacillus larvae subsp. pulvifaciens]AQZ49273.1 hypothetical protein B5S25_22465 [Paenibacillus larvae subsp. pulvifaciens]AVF28926.1 hypothetical protein ERICIII_04924 [Paenibacillus larvae subsp. larvae]AVF33308.1 hypothetical protein ERICIV_04544 [Paenibacillus larvae subsp. larvae]MBH0344818.1 hypothetical protein [Paenibacillus larvae]